MVVPMFMPNDREMTKYSPPPSTLLLVAISERASAVGMVTRCPRRIIPITPQNPRVPTANPNLRKRIAPRMVEMAVKKTGAVPNDFFASVIAQLIRYQIYHFERHLLCKRQLFILIILQKSVDDRGKST